MLQSNKNLKTLAYLDNLIFHNKKSDNLLCTVKHFPNFVVSNKVPILNSKSNSKFQFELKMNLRRHKLGLTITV